MSSAVVSVQVTPFDRLSKFQTPSLQSLSSLTKPLQVTFAVFKGRMVVHHIANSLFFAPIHCIAKATDRRFTGERITPGVRLKLIHYGPVQNGKS
jgi:hypothetical protein